MSARSCRPGRVTDPLPELPPRPSRAEADMSQLFTLSTNDLVITREHFVALVAVQGRAELGWVVDGIEAELADRAGVRK